MPISGKNIMELVIAARDNTKGAFAKVGAQMHSMKGKTVGLNTGMKGLKGTMGKMSASAGKLVSAIGPLGIAGAALAAGAAVGLFAVSAVKSFTAFEDSMANVRKTTGMTKEETNALGESIDKLALRLPVAHGELAKIAAIAGQLGIQGEESILGFTEDIAKMSTAFDMSAESAATAMAKMANIYDIPIENVSALGSAINVLGNTTAAQESAIMDFAMSLGASAKQLGFCETEAVAMGATLISMGMDASASGTRLNSAFTQMAKNLDKVALFLGISEDKFRTAFGKDPMAMVTKIVTKLSQIEDPLERAAAGADMFGLIGAKSINALSGDLDGLQTNLANAAKGFEENTSLTEEFAAKTDTLKAKFALIGNAAESLKINIGAALAPLVGVLAEGAIRAISNMSEGFNALQKVVGDIHGVFKAFFDSVKSAVSGAFKPLTDMLHRNREEVNKLNVILKIFSDILVIVTAGAGKLGTIIGNLLSRALTPFIAKIQEGIAILANFYDKLGPIKGLFELVKAKVGAAAEGISEWADSLEEAKPPAEALTEAVEELTVEAEKVGPALIESIKTLGSRLTEASGSYKTAIGDITKEIDSLKDAWNMASDDQKGAIEEQIKALEGVRDELTRGEEDAKKYFDTHTTGTEKAIEKQEEFTIKIGETTVTFSDMAAEVVENAEAYAKLQQNAETLLDLDWSVFSELNDELPNIDKGIKDMSSAFVGLKDVLEDNIEELDAVRTSIQEIGEIAAPFLEEGFLNGVEAIGKFAGALSTVGSAINTFAGLQDVSIEGCINFSLRVNDMVSALQILETQMEDLVPAFGDMDSLISDIADAFLYGAGKAEGFSSSFDDVMRDVSNTVDNSERNFEDFKETVDASLDTKTMTYWGRALDSNNLESDRWRTITVSNFYQVESGMKAAGEAANLYFKIGDATKARDFFAQSTDTIKEWAKNVYGATLTTEELNEVMGLSTEEQSKWLRNFMGTNTILENTYASNVKGLREWTKEVTGTSISTEEAFRVMSMSAEEQKKWLDKLMHSEEAVTFQMNKQTDALKSQAEELTKITDALQPYLEFMRTLNDLAALSAISTTDLNNGLNSIRETLENLSTAFVDFELESVMQSLFGSGIEGEAGGTAEAFTDTMLAHSAKFETLIAYIGRLSTAITTLTGAFKALEDINESVLADETALLELFGNITKIMENFSNVMDKSGFGEKLALGLDKMITSAAPLSDYFKKNNAAVTDFNNSLNTFNTTMTTVLALVDKLKEITEATVPEIADLAAGFDKASEFVRAFDEALLMHMGMSEGATRGSRYFDSIFVSLRNFAEQWETTLTDMKDDIEVFEDTASAITGIIETLISLSEAFKAVGETTLVTEQEMKDALGKITLFVSDFTSALSTNLGGVVEELEKLSLEWAKHSVAMGEVMPAFDDATTKLIGLAEGVLSVNTAFTTLNDTTMLTEQEMKDALGKIMLFVSDFTSALSTNLGGVVEDLEKLSLEWAKHSVAMGEVMPAFDDATSIFLDLAGGVSSANDAFGTLNETTLVTEQEMKDALGKITLFVSDFTSALSTNLGGVVEELEKLSLEWAKHSVGMGEAMPAYLDSIWAITTLVEGITSLASALKKLSKMSAISTPEFDTGFLKIIESIGNFSTSLKKNVSGMITALKDLRLAWLENEAVIVPLMIDFIIITRNFKSLADNANLMNDSFSEVSENASSLEAGFDSLISIIEKVVKGTKEFYTPGTAMGIAHFIIDIGFVIEAFKVLSESVNITMSNIQKDIDWSVKDIRDKIRGLSRLSLDMFIYGSNLMANFIAGIRSWKQVLIAEMVAIANIIKWHLGVTSPTKLGPLQDLEKWPRNLVKSFASGIKSEMSTLNASFSGMALPAPGGTGGGNVTHISFNVTQNITDKSTADYSTRDLERMLSRHEVM